MKSTIIKLIQNLNYFFKEKSWLLKVWINGDKKHPVFKVEATVCGTHVSKSVLLPVYYLEENGIKLVFRCNFHG
jgi:phosphoglycerol transferase MdoB-like AlkP superfamily enzyme